MSDNKELFVGPFLGEFGWELFGWQGFIRTIAKDYDKIIVSSRESSRFIYSDFCDEFLPYDPGSYICSFFECMNHVYDNRFEEMYPNAKRIYTSSLKGFHKQYGNMAQSFHKYQSDMTVDKVDFVFHARKVLGGGKYKRDRNWDLNKWNELSDRFSNEGFSFASIGTEDSSYLVKNSLNYLGNDLEKTCAILTNSKMVIGSSSGPMHFATLCGCPQMVWTSSVPGRGGGNRKRYESHWNPFDTPVFVYEDEHWNPSVKSVHRATLKFLETLK